MRIHRSSMTAFCTNPIGSTATRQPAQTRSNPRLRRQKLGQCDRRPISANFFFPEGSISFDSFDFRRIRSYTSRPTPIYLWNLFGNNDENKNVLLQKYIQCLFRYCSAFLTNCQCAYISDSYLKYLCLQNCKMSQTSKINQRSDSETAADADHPLTDDEHHATDADVEMFQNQPPVRPNSQFSDRSHASAADGNRTSTSAADANRPSTSAADGNLPLTTKNVNCCVEKTPSADNDDAPPPKRKKLNGCA